MPGRCRRGDGAAVHDECIAVGPPVERLRICALVLPRPAMIAVTVARRWCAVKGWGVDVLGGYVRSFGLPCRCPIRFSGMVRGTAGSRGGEPVALILRAMFRSVAGDVLACWDRNNGLIRARAGDPWGRYWCWRVTGSPGGVVPIGVSLAAGFRFPVRGARPEGDLRARSGECPMFPRGGADDGTGTLGTVERCPMAVR